MKNSLKIALSVIGMFSATLASSGKINAKTNDQKTTFCKWSTTVCGWSPTEGTIWGIPQ